MAKGENIFKRKDGRWEARYIKGRDIAGKIFYGYCYGRSYKEAKDKVTKRKADLMNGKSLDTPHRDQPFDVYCDEWLLRKKGRLKASSYIKYETILERHIKPYFGACMPSCISNQLIDQFSYQLQTRTLASKTIKDILSVLHSIIVYAQRQCPGYYQNIEICYPADISGEMRILTMEEQKHFVEYLMTDLDSCKFGILLSLYTGLRIGEICALKWENISLSDNTLAVQCTMQRLRSTEDKATAKTKVLIDKPKSASSVRLIPIMPWLVSLCKKMQPSASKAYVLTGTLKYMEPRLLQYHFQQHAKQCQLEGIHFHSLRHTFATRCVEVDFEIKSLSEILGHTNINITLNRYVHSSMELKRKNMDKLSAAF